MSIALTTYYGTRIDAQVNLVWELSYARIVHLYYKVGPRGLHPAIPYATQTPTRIITRASKLTNERTTDRILTADCGWRFGQVRV